jgi:translation initiation factor IF-2
MAKKRVHELAKQYDMPFPEVLKRLNAYGLKVKAAASAVDEDEAERALTGKPPKQTGNGKPEAKEQRPGTAAQQTGMGFDRPASESARQRLVERQQRLQAAQQREQKQQQPDKPAEKRQEGAGAGAGGDQRRQRPTRSSLQGERAPGTAGGVRRVVIDSQASRPGPGGPGGPGGRVAPGGPGVPGLARSAGAQPRTQNEGSAATGLGGNCGRRHPPSCDIEKLIFEVVDSMSR